MRPWLLTNRPLKPSDSIDLTTKKMSESTEQQPSPLPIEVSISTDLERRIADAFDIFDHGGSKTIDVREVGTVLRSLGCCPTEAEIQEILVKVEDIETSSVHLARFLPIINQIITERKLQPAPPEDLLQAFQTLDKENKGCINREYLSRLIVEEGEPFSQEELDEMMTVAADIETGNIPYEYYINQIMVRQKRNQKGPKRAENRFCLPGIICQYKT